MAKHLCKNLAETEAAAAVFIANLEANKSGATIVGLLGDLGSGKTAFTQAIARQLGVTERVTSPTFVIQKNYSLNLGENGSQGSTLESLKVGPSVSPRWERLVHIDAYRLHRPEELAHLKWAEVVVDTGNLIIIEWADRVLSLLPAGAHKVMFHFIDKDTREINF